MPRRLVQLSSDQNHYSSPVISRIMLRFRPIAPKPASATGSLPDNHLVGKRTKRKYVRVRARRMKKIKAAETKKPSPPETSEVEDAPPPPPPPVEKEVVTLQLLPERSDFDYSKKDEKNNTGHVTAAMGEVDNNNKVKRKHPVEAWSSSVIQTWVIAECVSTELDDKSMGGLGFSMRTDPERIYDLERDTCPGFVSDGRNKVIWVNEAYRRMVGATAQVSVVLVVKEAVQIVQMEQPAWFACRVRLWVDGDEDGGQKWQKRILACDVWRMEFPWGACFAWKLDLHTALSLSPAARGGLGPP